MTATEAPKRGTKKVEAIEPESVKKPAEEKKPAVKGKKPTADGSLFD
jgi:hypothetical protein